MVKKKQYLMLLIRDYLYGIVCFQGSGLISCQKYRIDINSSALYSPVSSFLCTGIFHIGEQL